MKKLLFLLIIPAVILFNRGRSDAQIKSVDINSLVGMMQGSFSSEEQARNDSDYFDIRLHMKRMWTDSENGKWLYVEQATAESPDKPYRQRVYHITNTYEGRFKSDVYTLNDPLRFAGEWMNENPLENLTPDSLTLKEGCSVIIILMTYGNFEGSTEGTDCRSDLRGAKYATSEVKINNDEIVSWDRGYDEAGKQVWGAVKGGYIFKRLK